MMRKNVYIFSILLILTPLLFCAEQQALKDARIGFLVMATGKYVRYIEPLVQSCEQHFLAGHKRTYFVFTDNIDQVPKQECIVPVYQKRLGWPYDTLMRCHVYVSHKELYKDIDYLFACDADTLCVDFVGEEILGDLVATRHPCFEFRRGEYDDNSESKAYVASSEGEHYFAGGFYGGKTSNFIDMNEIMVERIKIDLGNGIMPRWHDESHLNRYFIDHKPTLILSPEYCWAAPWCNHLRPRMVVAGKELVRGN